MTAQTSLPMELAKREAKRRHSYRVGQPVLVDVGVIRWTRIGDFVRGTVVSLPGPKTVGVEVEDIHGYRSVYCTSPEALEVIS